LNLLRQPLGTTPAGFLKAAFPEKSCPSGENRCMYIAGVSAARIINPPKHDRKTAFLGIFLNFQKKTKDM